MNTSLKLLTLIIFPWKRLGSVHLNPNFSSTTNPFQYSSLSEFLTKEQPFKLLAQFSLKLLIFFNQLLFLICFAQIVGDKVVFSSVSFIHYVLALSIVLRYILTQLLLWVELSLRQFYVECLGFTFENTLWNNAETSTRVIGRDIITSIQTIPYIIDGVFISCAFVGSVILAYLIIGIDALFGLCTLSIFIPLSCQIAKKRSSLAKKIYLKTQEKLDKINHWQNWHLYLESWSLSQPFLQSIKDLMRGEIQLRNQDSLWRACDLYSICFGKLIPILTILLLSLLMYPISSGLLTTLWLSVPIVNVIITYNRFQKEMLEGDAAFTEIKNQISSLSSENTQPIIVEDNWEIWCGSLGENICDFNHCFNVLSKLHLEEELLLGTQNPHSVLLDLGGQNLSSGQKSRVLLARGINLALKYQRPIQVDMSFNSLDASNKQRVNKCLNDLSKLISVNIKSEIGHSDSVEMPSDSTSQQLNRSNAIAASANNGIVNPAPSLFKDILRLYRPFFLLMLVPAIGLNILSSMTVINISENWRFILLTSFGLGTFALVLALGKTIEAHVREWAFTTGYHLLKYPLNFTKADFFQRMSENYRTVCERISWYIHDGTWITSLLVFAMISSMYIIGWGASIVSIAFIALCFYVWKILNPAVIFTRQATISGFNHYLSKMANLVAMTTSPRLEIFNRMRKRESYEAFDTLFVSQIESDVTKFAFCTTLYIISGMLVVAITQLSFHIPQYESLLSLVISAFLYVDYNIIMFFQALSGFNAQRIALHRLSSRENNDHEFKSLFVKEGLNYQTKEYFNSIVNQKYLPYIFQSGQSYSIVGNSGAGKTLYLRCIAGMQLSQKQVEDESSRESAIYLDRQSVSILNKLKENSSDNINCQEILSHFVENKLLEEKRIFIFDEALVNFPLQEAKALSVEFAKRIESFKGIFLLVDHRFNLQNVIPLNKIVDNDKIITNAPISPAYGLF